MKKSWWKYLYISTKSIMSLCVVAVFLLLSPIGFLYFAFGREEIAIKRAIDNPYVNGRFADWNAISSEKYGEFQLPEDWSFIDRNESFSIFDNKGNLWAVGTIFGTDSDAYLDRKSFVESVLECSISSLEYLTNENFVNMSYGSGVSLISVHAANEEIVYYLDLNSDLETNTFVVILEHFDSDNMEYDIAEAIVYSYSYD